MAIVLDITQALGAVISAVYTDTSHYTPAVMERISTILGYGIAGYFDFADPQIIRSITENGFGRTAQYRAMEYERRGLNNLDPVEEIDGIIHSFLPPFFYQLTRGL